MITVCFVYFRSLTLLNLEAALYSVRKQNLSDVDRLVVLDNNTDDSSEQIQAVIDKLDFPIPVALVSHKHGDLSKTHSWSTNAVVREAKTEWVFFTRADYLLEFNTLELFLAETTSPKFIVGRYYDVQVDVGVCNTTRWRIEGPGKTLQQFGQEYSHTLVDSGVWMTTKQIFDSVGGMDESMHAWGHSQTAFQYKLYLAGVDFIKVPHIVFYHPIHHHEVGRDWDLAMRQVTQAGFDLRTMWKRYEGRGNPYP